MYPLDRLLSEMKSMTGAARLESLTNYRIQSTTSCVNATLLLAVFTAAVRSVTVLFDKLVPRLDGAGLDVDALRANVLRLLAMQLIDRGLPSLASFVTPVVKRHIASCPLPLTAPASPEFVSVFFQGIITVSLLARSSICTNCDNAVLSAGNHVERRKLLWGGRECTKPCQHEQWRFGWWLVHGRSWYWLSFIAPAPIPLRSVHCCQWSPVATGSVARFCFPVRCHRYLAVLSGWFPWLLVRDLCCVILGSESADVAPPSTENRVALRILDVLWDIMESAAFTPALLASVQVSQEVLVSSAQYCAFPDARPVSIVVSRVSEWTAEPEAVPPALPAHIKPVTHVNVIVAFRNVLRRLLRADIPETYGSVHAGETRRACSTLVSCVSSRVPMQVAQCPALSEVCASIMQYMVIPDSVFCIPVVQ
jgi:hypothetical protein